MVKKLPVSAIFFDKVLPFDTGLFPQDGKNPRHL